MRPVGPDSREMTDLDPSSEVPLQRPSTTPLARPALVARLVSSARSAPRARSASLTPPASLTRSAPLAFPLVVGLLSRIYSTALLLLVPPSGPHPPILIHQSTSPLLAWDAQWYLSIAKTGYHAVPQQVTLGNGLRYDFAFYPAWPTLIRAGSFLGIPPEVVAVALANVLFIIALVVIHVVLARRFDRVVAGGAVLLLAFAPASYVASMGYSEPLFLLAVGAYFALRGSRYRPIAAALTVVTRVTGLAVMASALVAAGRDRQERGRLLASALVIALSFIGWWAFIWSVVGTPDGWLRGSPAWLPVEGLPAVAQVLASPQPQAIAWLGVVVLMLGCSLVLLRRDLELGVYAVAAIGMSVLGAPVSSMPRHTLVAFPAFAILAQRLGRRGTVAAAAGFALLQVWFVAAAFGNGMMAP
jgi:hypothetical protein